MSERRESVAEWLGLNRATLAVLAVIGCLGLSEEIWRTFLGIHLTDVVREASPQAAVMAAVTLVGIISFATNLLEGFGYIIGGTLAHRMGPRLALTVSAAPSALGYALLLSSGNQWAMVTGALLMTNWEPLSVPATFDVVGSEVPKHRRTIAFAVQSIQKRLPKVIGPLGGGYIFEKLGYQMNLTVAVGLVVLAVVLQLALSSRMKPKAEPAHTPFKEILRGMPRDLRMLLTAEIFIRWGDWFARDFTTIYVVSLLMSDLAITKGAATLTAGSLIAITNITALATYIPIAKLVDRSPSPKPFIGLTFFLFALFPISLVLLPKLSTAIGLPIMVGLVVTYVLNGLRELGEPARKALISTGFPPNIRARAVGLYWGLRSFAFCPAPLVAAYSWHKLGPDTTFLIGGSIGLLGTAWFALTNKRA